MDNGDFGHPDSSPRQWGTSQGSKTSPEVAKGQEDAITSGNVLSHGLQHADYKKLTGGSVKDVGSITKKNGK